MLISDFDALVWLEEEAISLSKRMETAYNDAVARGVKNPGKSTGYQVERARYQSIITAIRCIEWERACRKAGKGVMVPIPSWEDDIDKRLNHKRAEMFRNRYMKEDND